MAEIVEHDIHLEAERTGFLLAQMGIDRFWDAIGNRLNQEFGDENTFDRSERLYPEMDLCQALYVLEDQDRLPIDFELVDNVKVIVYGEDYKVKEQIAHVFLRTGDYVVCLTPGQFLTDLLEPSQLPELNKPGERIKYMKRMIRESGVDVVIQEAIPGNPDTNFMIGTEEEILYALRLDFLNEVPRDRSIPRSPALQNLNF